MMSEEEKEAITWFKQHVFDWTEFIIEENVDILLNLIEKQQKELNQLTEENTMLKGMFKKSMKE